MTCFRKLHQARWHTYVVARHWGCPRAACSQPSWRCCCSPSAAFGQEQQGLVPCCCRRCSWSKSQNYTRLYKITHCCAGAAPVPRTATWAPDSQHCSSACTLHAAQQPAAAVSDLCGPAGRISRRPPTCQRSSAGVLVGSQIWSARQASWAAADAQIWKDVMSGLPDAQLLTGVAQQACQACMKSELSSKASSSGSSSC